MAGLSFEVHNAPYSVVRTAHGLEREVPPPARSGQWVEVFVSGREYVVGPTRSSQVGQSGFWAEYGVEERILVIPVHGNREVVEKWTVEYLAAYTREGELIARRIMTYVKFFSASGGMVCPACGETASKAGYPCSLCGMDY